LFLEVPEAVALRLAQWTRGAVDLAEQIGNLGQQPWLEEKEALSAGSGLAAVL
jgi:hypothetical protein